MLKFYYHPTPNPVKIALFLAEADLPFELIPVDTHKGEQHQADFRAINPNGKLPAIEDDGKAIFDSTAILLYLAEKTNRFLGKAEDRGALLSWLMFIGSGLGPYSGQSVHFRLGAPERIPYATNRYLFEAKRHYQILEDQLADKPYILGDEYTIVDISAWGWIDRVQFVLGEEGLSNYPNLSRWFDRISARPAVAKARQIGADLQFKTERDEEALRALFPQNF